LIKKAAVLLIKLSVSSALLYFLVSRIGGKTILRNMQLLDKFAFISAAGTYIIAAYVSTLRWKLLIPSQCKTSRLFSIYMIGSFFNTYMPGLIGGDVVKAFYLNKELHVAESNKEDPNQPGQSPPLVVSIASVFMDRYIGFSALIFISMIAFPFGLSYLKKASVQFPVIWFIPSVTCAFLVASVVIFKFRIGASLKFLLNAYQYLHYYSSQKKLLAKCFLYSIMVQVLTVLAVFILSNGLHLEISLLLLLVFLPIIILISILPVSISGLGLREGAFVFLLGSIGLPAEKSLTLSIAWFLSVFVAGIWGLFEYLRFKKVNSENVR
jgi:uncharacterized membrane protein YbhN (UPF0104 family)